MLDRLDVELGHHGGTENGNLIVTYRQFEAYGIHKDSVGPARRELEALGFIEITERGCAGNAGFGKPNKFRLTFHPAEGAPSDGSHEWRRFKTIEDAERAKEEARELRRRTAPTVAEGGFENKSPLPVSSKIHPRKPWVVRPRKPWVKNPESPAMPYPGNHGHCLYLASTKHSGPCNAPT